MFIGALQRQERSLGDGLSKLARHHVDEPGLASVATKLARWSHAHVAALDGAAGRYAAHPPFDLKLFVSALFAGPRTGQLGLLQDLQELILLAGEVQLGWALVGQAARALRDHELIALAKTLPTETERQKEWLETRIKAAAPQTLVVG
jgi:hypothetical protein